MNIVLIVIVIVFLSLFLTKKESFSPDNKEDMDFVRALQRFIHPAVEYDEYVEFLTKNENKYSSLEDFKTFVILQNLKKIGQLSVDNIAKFMN